MDSKRTTPKPGIPRTFAKASGIAGVVWAVLALAGCPYRSKEIRITETGALALFSACAGSFGGGGGGPPPPGPGNGGGFDDFCTLTGQYSSGPMRVAPQARLFLISPGDQKIQDASKCMHLKSCSDGGRYGPQPSCIADDINQQLDGAMPNGLGFAGFKNSEDAQLMMAFYAPNPATSEDDEGCHRSDLVECAGLAAPLGGGAYDITCASCEGGSRTPYGSNTGPCPKGPSGMQSCFLKICDGILSANNYD